MATELSADSKIVLKLVQRIAKTLLWGAGVAGAAVASRCVGATTIEVWSVDIPVGAVALVLAAGTVAHIFWTCFLIAALQRVAGYGDIESETEAERLFDEIRTSDGILLGLIPRTQETKPGSRFVRMALGDPTTWLAIGLAVLAAAAILPWYWDDGLQIAEGTKTAGLVVTAVVVVLLNWWAGGLWAIGVSRITTPEGFEHFRLFEGSTIISSEAAGARAALVAVALLAGVVVTVVVIAF